MMTTFETNRTVPLGSVATLRVVSLLERVCDAVTAWRSARATGVELQRLSNEQLADIGLTRSDILPLVERMSRHR